jgi:hypothetical protein
MVTGAIVGALAATVDDHTLAASARTSSTTPADTNTQFDTLNSQLAGGLTDMNIESVDHTTSDQELLQEGFASVIDVVLYAPVVAGKTHRSSFVLLHKMRARSLIGAFDTRTWYREQVSNTRPVYDWFANDNRAIQAQLLILQVNLLHDLQRVFGDAPTEIIR